MSVLAVSQEHMSAVLANVFLSIFSEICKALKPTAGRFLVLCKTDNSIDLFVFINEKPTGVFKEFFIISLSRLYQKCMYML